MPKQSATQLGAAAAGALALGDGVGGALVVGASDTACVDAVVAWPAPYSRSPTVSPMTVRMTTKRIVPLHLLRLMTCSVLLGG